MPKKKRKKYSFLAEQKRIENQERENFFDGLEKDRDLALTFLDNYTSKFPRLYQHFQEQLEGSVPGCIYMFLDKQKTTQQGTRLRINFFAKGFFESMLDNFPQHPGIQNVLALISAWEQDRQLVPIAVSIGYCIEATTFPVPSEQEIIDSPPLPPTSSSAESLEDQGSPLSDS